MHKFLIVLLCSATPAMALIVPIEFETTAIEDAATYSDDPTGNYGTAVTLEIAGQSDGMFALDTVARSFMKFDLSDIPDDAEIISAVFGVYLLETNNGGFDTVDPHATLHRLADDTWTQASVTWGTMPTDLSEQIDEQLLLTDPGVYMWDLMSTAGDYTWDDAQYYLDLDDDLLSLVLITPDENANNWATFNSSEAQVVKGADPAILPFVRIEYLPEPTTLGLLGLGALALRRRKK